MCVNLGHINLLLPTILGLELVYGTSYCQEQHALWDIILYVYKVARQDAHSHAMQ